MDTEKPQKFSDVLAALVAGVAQARSVTDVEALRMAYRYRQNELLKGLPIPRLRIKRISIRLPLILTGLTPGSPAEANVPSVIVEAADAAFSKGIGDARRYLTTVGAMENVSPEEKKIDFYQELFDALEKLYHPDTTNQQLGQAIEQAMRALQDLEGDAPSSDTAIRDAVGDGVVRVFGELLDEASFLYLRSTKGEAFDSDRARQSRDEIRNHPFVQRVMQDIRRAAEQAAINKPTVSPDVTVSVNTDNIKNAGGGADTVTRLSMVLLEEGLEWLTESRDRAETSKLLPE